MLTYYGPLRLPTRPNDGYVFQSSVGQQTTTTLDLPSSSTDLSARAAPITAGGPMAVYTHFFTTGRGLHNSPEGRPHSNCVTRPDQVHLRYGSRVRSAGLRPFGLLRGPPAPLPVERVSNRVTTVQTTRSDRLSLAHRRNRTQEMHPKSSSKCQGLFPFPGGIIFQLLKSWQQRYHRRRNR